MTTYKDINGDSGVLRYKINNDKIIVEFKGGSQYLYTYASAGQTHIEKMKVLAQNGDGLNSYINKYVKKQYESKLR
ncbi:MAG: hypothetical protein C0626_07265 [Arcobacter sp.]|uniref:hypothetical protein n=1 Tax=uncultured Arcobacter sp. TaxID=165434 RepID=UPI000CAD92FF|nr:hypothetical protein [uncultured Arcobacter sp.]PLY09981.1 MAG: hypothetical protein C0626_07265 [Arcobacter sp.]